MLLNKSIIPGLLNVIPGALILHLCPNGTLLCYYRFSYGSGSVFNESYFNEAKFLWLRDRYCHYKKIPTLTINNWFRIKFVYRIWWALCRLQAVLNQKLNFWCLKITITVIRPSKRKGRKPAARANENGPYYVHV